jgi:hypothetical protein
MARNARCKAGGVPNMKHYTVATVAMALSATILDAAQGAH